MKKPSGILFLLLGCMGVLLVLAALGLWFVVACSNQKLKTYKTQLEQRGETFDIAKLSPPPPPKENNGGEELVAAASALGATVASGSLKPFSPGRLESSPGLAEIVHKRHATTRAKKDAPWEDLRMAVALLHPHLEKVRSAAKAPILEVQSDYSQGFAMRLPHVSPFLVSSQFLAAESVLLLRDGKPAKAVENIEAMLVIASMTGRQPNWISLLVYASILQMASHSTWEVLQADVAPRELDHLWKAWQSLQPGANVAWAMRMERAWGVLAFSASADIEFQLNGSSSPPFPDKIIAAAPNILWAAIFRFGDEYWFLEKNQTVLENLDVRDWKMALNASRKIHASTESRGISRKLSHMILHTLHGLLEKLAFTEAMNELCVSAIAIRRYQMEHQSQLPDTLQDLVPSYLDTIPKDIMDGNPLRYQRSGQNFLLYSLGRNGVDDGGNSSAIPGKKRRDLLEGLDIVWPQVAPDP